MLLNFVFMARRGELAARANEFAYARRMSEFFGSWIAERFGRRLDVRCDEMAVDSAGALDRHGVHTLLRDHRARGESTWHFYLANFRPLWTDSLAEGYHSENMCMTLWRRPGEGADATAFMAKKNCAEVSYELAHELLRQEGRKGAADAVNSVWSRHFSGELPLVAYGKDHRRTSGAPDFLTLDASLL